MASTTVTRLRTITIGAAVLLTLVLGILAYLLADAQGEDREEVRNRFDDVARVSASVTDGIFQASLEATRQQATTRLAAPRPTDAAVQAVAVARQLVYAAVLDSRGRPLASTPGAPRRFDGVVRTALESGEGRLSDVVRRAGKPTIDWAIPYQAQAGEGRLYVQGIPTSAFGDFLTRALGDLPNFADAETAMIDGNGVVLGGVNLSTGLGKRLPDEELLDAVGERDRGDYAGDRYFASGGIDGSPFRIVLDTTQERLYDDVRTTVPWIIFAAFALTALAGLFVLRRALAAAAELERRELNERHAVEINDNIIQGLALAKYQLQMGAGEESRAQVADTLREAQRLVSGLLGEAEVQAGQLRREVAAETSRPEEPSS